MFHKIILLNAKRKLRNLCPLLIDFSAPRKYYGMPILHNWESRSNVYVEI